MESVIAEPNLMSKTLDSRRKSICRQAFYLDGDQGPVFSWLHRPEDQETHHGVVICAPLGFEQLHAHRGLRHLADELAARGLSVLRFDWSGTGDSAGEDLDPDRYSAWLADIQTAVRWMKTRLDCSRISVIGLRMGATLAAMALQAEEIQELVLWAPITNGRAFVRELTVIDKMSDAPVFGTNDGIIEAAGFRMSSETAADISRANLLKSQPDCRRVLIAHRDDLAADERLADHFCTLGITVEQKSLPGMAQMLVEPHKGETPTLAIKQIADWLTQERLEEVLPDALANEICPTFISAQAQIQHGRQIISEHAWQINHSPFQFGIVSEPVAGPDPDLPIVVLLNAGTAYRVGPGRLGVELTRHLTAQGFRCLRLDLSGIGDSLARDPAAENDSYSSAAFRDIEFAIQSLRARFGAKKFILMGLCSGAYFAFQSAAQFADRGLVECLLINPLTFFWREGMSLESAPTLELIREHYYLRSALQPRKWLKLLTGRSSIGIRGALKMVRQRLVALGAPAEHRKPPSPPLLDSTPSHPLAEDLAGDLQRIANSGRFAAMFFSTTDPGYSILMAQAGRQARHMVRSGHLSVTFVEHADHTFSRFPARQKLIDLVSRHLKRWKS